MMKNIKINRNSCIDVEDDSVIFAEDGTKALIMIRPKKDVKIDLTTGKNCDIRSFIVQSSGCSVTQVNHAGASSVIRSSSFWFHSGDVNIINSLEGDGAEAYDMHIFVEKGEVKLHLDTVLHHIAKNTKGSILVKGIVYDKASAKLDGMIKIDKNGAGAESFLSEHVMLMSPQAHASANPELEIENNDVSSRHAASVAQIDEEKLFYLISRGISRDEAKRLIVEGFLSSAIERIEDPDIRRELLEKTMSEL